MEPNVALPLMPVRQESRAAREIREIFQSGRPLVYIRTVEEQRVNRLLHGVAAQLYETPLPVWTWSLTEGLRRGNNAAEPGTQDPRKALDYIAAQASDAIFHLKDFHEPLRGSAEVRRRLRDVYDLSQERRKFVVITSAIRFVPEELERSLVFVELRPPDRIELGEVLRDETGAGALDDATVNQLAGVMLGLTVDEARYAVRRAKAVDPRLGPDSLPRLLEEKRLLVSRSGIIDFIAEGANIGEIGGLENHSKE